MNNQQCGINLDANLFHDDGVKLDDQDKTLDVNLVHHVANLKQKDGVNATKKAKNDINTNEAANNGVVNDVYSYLFIIKCKYLFETGNYCGDSMGFFEF